MTIWSEHRSSFPTNKLHTTSLHVGGEFRTAAQFLQSPLPQAGESLVKGGKGTAVRYPKGIYFSARSIRGWGILSVPGTAQTHGSVATKRAEGGCGDDCEDKGGWGCVCELHCMSEHCQSSPFYSSPLLNHYSPGEVCCRVRESCCRRGEGISQKDAKPYSLPGERKVVAKSSLPIKKLE